MWHRQSMIDYHRTSTDKATDLALVSLGLKDSYLVELGQFTVWYLPDLTDGNHTMAEAVSYRGFSNNREICINKCMFDRNGSVQRLFLEEKWA